MRTESIQLRGLVRIWPGDLLLTLVICLGLWSGPALGAIYKWVDENGKVHYSDQPPPEESSQELDIESDSSSTTPSLSDEEHRQKQQRLLDAYAKERADKKAERAKAAEEDEKLRVWCARAKDELRLMNQAGYLYDYDESGQKIIYSKEKRESATRAYAAEIEEKC